MGIVYGVIAAALILLLMFFGIRKRWYRSRLGTMDGWLQSHIYLGVLTLFIALAHTGGRFNDKVAVATLIVLAVVVLSGVVGAILYASVPRVLTEVESNLTADEISEKLNQLSKAMSRITSGKSDAFRRIHERLISEIEPRPLAGWRLLFSSSKRRSQPAADFAKLLSLVERGEQEELRQLLVISRQQKELHTRLIYQQRYRNILESWLYLHLPVSIALLVLLIAHVVAVFYYAEL